MMIPIIGDAIEGLISSTLGQTVSKLLDFIPDPAERAKQAAEVQEKLLEADSQMVAAQNAINLAEATNQSLFVSGWRPAVGWICAAGLGWQVFLAPLLTFMIAWGGWHPNFPTIDSSYISILLIPLLGLGAMKSAERIGGVSNEGQKPTQAIIVRSKTL